MKTGGTLTKIVFLVLLVALVASLTANASLWREFTALDRYAEIRKQVNRRLGMGRDAQTFVTPDNPAVAAKVKELTTDYSGDPHEYWLSCELLYRWVVANIEYVPDSYTPMLPESMNGEITWVNDCWRMPEETLKDKAGDCEDMSALLASMLLNYNKHTYGVWMVEVRNKDGGHVGVVFPVQNGMITVVDPSIRYNTESDGSIVLNAKEAGTAINLWLAALNDKLPDAQVVMVFSDTLYQEFTGTADFLTWVKTNVK